MTTLRNYLALTVFLVGIAGALSSCSTGPETPDGPDQRGTDANEVGDTDTEPMTLRLATFNTSLSRGEAGQLVSDLEGGDDQQAQRVAEILQRVRPDVVLLNEFDRDDEGRAATIFEEAYLSKGQNGASPLDYSHRYVPKTNTGVHSGVDLDGNGRAVSTPGEEGYGNDAYGFGEFPGQYGMVVYSRFLLETDRARSFRTFPWRDMPDHLIPTDWYSSEAVEALRLSSKNHVDLPVRIGGDPLHLLISHPTPPAFDGPEDRNGRRNHDEIRFWHDYVSGGESAGYIRDDAGNTGGLAADASFAILGDLNLDPRDGDGRHEAIRELLDHPRTADPQPESAGGEEAAESDGGANQSHEGDPRLDTADFPDDDVGNLRVDYALPSSDLDVRDSGVYWPSSDSEHADLVDVSDHRLVWVDVAVEVPAGRVE